MHNWGCEHPQESKMEYVQASRGGGSDSEVTAAATAPATSEATAPAFDAAAPMAREAIA